MMSVHWIFIVVIVWTGAWPDTVTAEVVSGAEIRFLLDEEASLRQSLESRVVALKQRASNLQNTFGKMFIFFWFGES